MKRMYLCVTAVCFLLSVTACRNDGQLFENEVLVFSGESVVTVGEYMKALEVAKTAYPHRFVRNKEAFQTIQVRLLAQMIEELIIAKVAAEKNIVLTEEEFRAAVDEIKKDYPDGVFEEVLLENAITEHLWESRLKKRLLMEKVLRSEFDSKINISPTDMTSYYEEHAEAIESEFENGEDEQQVYDRILRRMKLEKKQGAYQEWIERKRSDYSIEVNEKIWEKILNS